MPVMISGFCDEITSNFNDQLAAMRRLGLRHAEIRLIDSKPITTLQSGLIPDIRNALSSFSVRPSAIGSRIGKIDITEPFEKHYAEFQYAVQIALAVKCKNIRIFSFYIPGEKYAEYRDKVLSRLSKMIDYAAKYNITLLHENEKGIYGDIPKRVYELFENLSCTNFKAVFDFANFVQCGADTLKAYELLKPYIDYFHIKDAKKEDGQVVPAGYGDGQVETILRLAIADGYDGYLSLEPHLGKFSGFDSLEAGKKSKIISKTTDTGEQKFALALESLKDILSRIPGTL